jgi:phosphate uptake regulator
MQIRKLVKAGAVSHTVSLPKSWIAKNHLKKGDLVYIRENSDNELLITPEIKEKRPIIKEINIHIVNKEFDTIQREITSAYVNNYATINIIDKELYKKIKEIRKILHNFIAMEITEQTSTKIVVKDLLNINEVSIEKTIRRMDIIIRSMLQDLGLAIDSDDMRKSIYYRDFDINKLYFLIYKLIKKALHNPDINNYLNISDTEQFLSIWYLTLNLENIADSIKNICLLFKEAKRQHILNKMKNIYSELENTYLNAMNSYYKNDKNLADKVASNRDVVFKKLISLSENYNQATIVKITESLKEIENFICNIARIVIDKE